MIAIDIRFLSENMRNGIISSGTGVFFSEVIAGIRENRWTDSFLLLVDKEQENAARKLFPEFRIKVLNYWLNNRYHILLYPLHQLIDGYRTRRLLKNNQVDCLWFPMATPFDYLYTGIPTVSTLHDLIPLHNNPKSISWKIGCRLIVNKSLKVVTDSQYVRDDIIETFSLGTRDSQKIISIPCPVIVDEENYKQVKKMVEKPYILDVNAYQPRKNGITLIKAFHRISKEIDCNLVFCGGYDAEDTLKGMQNYANRIGLGQRVHFFLALPIEERNWLIANAKLLVSPSLSEGFGRTPIEAALYKIPVLTTKSDSLYEVTLGLLNYYDNPKDYKELAKKIIEIIQTPPTNNELNEISKRFSDRYSKNRIAKCYYKVFSAVQKRSKRTRN